MPGRKWCDTNTSQFFAQLTHRLLVSPLQFLLHGPASQAQCDLFRRWLQHVASNLVSSKLLWNLGLTKWSDLMECCKANQCLGDKKGWSEINFTSRLIKQLFYPATRFTSHISSLSAASNSPVLPAATWWRCVRGKRRRATEPSRCFVPVPVLPFRSR